MTDSLAYIKLRCLGHLGFSECKDSDCCLSKSLREWRVVKCCLDLPYCSIIWGSQKTWLLPFWTATASKESTCQGCFGGHWLDLEGVSLPAYPLRKEQASCDVLDSSAMDHSENRTLARVFQIARKPELAMWHPQKSAGVWLVYSVKWNCWDGCHEVINKVHKSQLRGEKKMNWCTHILERQWNQIEATRIC